MSAFDDLCTKTTADSTWKYTDTIFVNIKEHNCINDNIETNSSVCSNLYHTDVIVPDYILDNLSRCKVK